MAIYGAEKQAGISVPESSVWKSSSVSDIVSPGCFPAYFHRFQKIVLLVKQEKLIANWNKICYSGNIFEEIHFLMEGAVTWI